MNILLTGGAGFIGSHIADAFIEDGHRVHVIDNLSSGTSANLPAAAIFHKMDVRDPDVTDLFEREQFDVLCHHAAQIDVRASVRVPAHDVDVNVCGLLNLMEAGRRNGLKKVILASTGGAIYGEPVCVPQDEQHTAQPLSPYGINKLVSEHYLYFYEQTYGISYTALRYANVYGPRQNAHGEAGVVAIFAEAFLDGKQPIIFGDGEQTRDFVYVGDVVEANRRALQEASSGSFNIGTGIETTINEIYTHLSHHAGKGQPARHAPGKPGEQRRSVLDYGLAFRTFGWAPQKTIREGLLETVEWFKTTRPSHSATQLL